jgi:hypothetical protein
VVSNRYLADSPLVGTVEYRYGGALRMTTYKQFDYLNRLQSIVNSNAVMLASSTYQYNQANQRTRVDTSFTLHFLSQIRPALRG